MDNYKVDHNKLIIGKIEVQFRDTIYNVLEIDNKLIVLLLNEPLNQKQPENNVYAVDKNGKILWQMQDPRIIYPSKDLIICVGIGINKNDQLYVTSFLGTVYYLNPENGRIIGFGYAK